MDIVERLRLSERILNTDRIDAAAGVAWDAAKNAEREVRS